MGTGLLGVLSTAILRILRSCYFLMPIFIPHDWESLATDHPFQQQSVCYASSDGEKKFSRPFRAAQP